MISTTFAYIILGFIILTAIVVSIIIIVEHVGGTFGDESMAPGCIMAAIGILVVIIGIGFYTKMIQ